MKPSTKILLWEQARVSGVIAAWLLLVGSLMQLVLWPGTFKGTMFAQDLHGSALVYYLLITFLGAMFLILRADVHGHLSFLFEPRHSRLPVVTPTLAWTIFGTRLLFMAVLCGLLWIILQLLTELSFPSWIPLIPILLFAVLQALVWSYRTVTWVGYALAALFLVLPIMVVVLHIYEINSGHAESTLLHWVTVFPYRVALYLGFLPGLVLSYLLGWLGVHYTRLDLTCGPPRLSSQLERLGDVLHPEARRFPSPFAAQLWYEWRRIGYLLPMLSVVVFIFLVLGITTLLATFLEEMSEGESMLAGDGGIIGFYAQFTPLLAVVLAAVIAGAMAIRPKSRYPHLRPLALRHSALALMLAQWKSLMLTLAVAMTLSVLGFLLFDAGEVRFLWGHFTAGRVSVPELLSIFFTPLLLTVTLAWCALWSFTRYIGINLLYYVFLLWYIPHIGVYINLYEDIHRGIEIQWPQDGPGFLYNLMMEGPPWLMALFIRLTDIYFLFFIFNVLLLSFFMAQAARKHLFQRRDWLVLFGVWLGLASYLTVFANFGFALLELMLMNLGLSAFIIAPFVMLPLIQLRRRVQ